MESSHQKDPAFPDLITSALKLTNSDELFEFDWEAKEEIGAVEMDDWSKEKWSDHSTDPFQRQFGDLDRHLQPPPISTTFQHDIDDYTLPALAFAGYTPSPSDNYGSMSVAPSPTGDRVPWDNPFQDLGSSFGSQASTVSSCMEPSSSFHSDISDLPYQGFVLPSTQDGDGCHCFQDPDAQSEMWMPSLMDSEQDPSLQGLRIGSLDPIFGSPSAVTLKPVGAPQLMWRPDAIPPFPDLYQMTVCPTEVIERSEELPALEVDQDENVYSSCHDLYEMSTSDGNDRGEFDLDWSTSQSGAELSCRDCSPSNDEAVKRPPASRRANRRASRKSSIQERRYRAEQKPFPQLTPQDDFLVRSKNAGKSYRQIREEGKFKEAESTLRGRYRTLTKPKENRVRRPEWSKKDDYLLLRAIKELMHVHAKVEEMGDPLRIPSWKIKTDKISWRRVAEFIASRGGTYHFGNATCRKRFDHIRRGRS